MTKPSRPFYNDFAWAYDLIINAPSKERCDFVDRALERNCQKETVRILDAGCGTGSYSIELASRGYSVTGVDSSEAQLRQAKEKALDTGTSVNFECHDLLKYNPTTKFDLVFCRGLLNDLITDFERKKIFQVFASSLKINGLLIFDVRDWEGSVKQKNEKPVNEKHLQTEHGNLHFISETTLNHELRLMEITECHLLESSTGRRNYNWNLTMRPWSIDEIDNTISSTGFQLIEQYGDFNENIRVGSTERLIIVAKKTDV